MALQTGPITVTDPILRILWNVLLDLQHCKARIRLQFIFGHCGIAKNEACDKEAETASDLPVANVAGAWLPPTIRGTGPWYHDEVAGITKELRWRNVTSAASCPNHPPTAPASPAIGTRDAMTPA
ncbi:hypothetical protein DQ04_12471000 [Trypanosoma grayi]|uniref:hypothetical protein n=1 Tax=Trypanosoma grayi TaxID=71804 RepID=UPI0004F4B9C9|nr:hypothetical protein DQ04_12471000 [Trypanosoma grayi]KEG06744.1 hypothetical protein DQ04_12471000 [Trypanosoma grayi]